jgi:uncharacterized protein (TIGR00159 family)
LIAAFTQLGWQNVVDFAVLVTTLYIVLGWASEARALRIVLAVVGLHAAALVVRHYELIMTAWVLEAAAVAVVLLLVVLFQPELRRALMRIDSRFHFRGERPSVLESVYETVGAAAFSMASSRTGALIVFSREQSVREVVEGGVTLGAEITREIIEAIFQKASPLHDGAILIEADRIIKAKVILPLTLQTGVPKAFGTRHRAAIGLAERSDAIIIVVSEGDGEVRLVRGTEVHLIASPADLAQALMQSLQRRSGDLVAGMRKAVTSRIRLKLAAAGLAGFIWSISFLTSAVVRIVALPVEFTSLPPGTEIADVSGETLQVELRGRPWLMDAIDVPHLVAHFDLSGAHGGVHVIPVRPDALDLPPGIHVDRVTPPSVTVRIEPARSPDRGLASGPAPSGQRTK